MAYTPETLEIIAPLTEGIPTFFIYDTDDTFATAIASGYFDPDALNTTDSSNQNLARNMKLKDFVYLGAADGQGFVRVNGINPITVTELT